MKLDDLTRYHFDWLQGSTGLHLADLARMSPDLRDQAEAALEANNGMVGPALGAALMAQVAGFAASERIVLEPSVRLVELFGLTGLAGVTPGMVRLPALRFYVHLEASGLTIESSRTDERHRVTGLYVSDWGEQWWITAVHHGQAERPIALTWPWPLRDWVRSGQGIGEYLEANYAMDEERADWYVSTLKLVCHLSLYMASSGASTQKMEDPRRRRLMRTITRFEGERRRAALEEIQAFSSAQVMAVGRDLGALAERASAKAHWVRGHWRAQWVGPKGAQHQEPRWIQPHVRGAGRP